MLDRQSQQIPFHTRLSKDSQKGLKTVSLVLRIVCVIFELYQSNMVVLPSSRYTLSKPASNTLAENNERAPSIQNHNIHPGLNRLTCLLSFLQSLPFACAGAVDEASWYFSFHRGESQPGWAWIIGEAKRRDGCTQVMPLGSTTVELVTLIKCLCQQLISLVCRTISNAEQFRN